MSDLRERVARVLANAQGEIHEGTWKYYLDAADRIAKLEAALEVCDRVLHFDLRKMITWGPDYNQAVKDAANVTRAALGGENE